MYVKATWENKRHQISGVQDLILNSWVVNRDLQRICSQAKMWSHGSFSPSKTSQSDRGLESAACCECCR